MKTILLLIVCFIALSIPAVVAQDQENPASKQQQFVRPNDVYLGYGAGGLFYWTGRMSHSSDFPSDISSMKYTDPSSVGALLLGYQRSLNRVVGLGFMFGYQDFYYTGTST